jgi:S1-C subfamily serine protease
MKPTRLLVVFSLLLFAGDSFSQTAPKRPTEATTANAKQTTEASLPYDQARLVTASVMTIVAAGVPQGIGSAVWLGDTGYLATCEHVIRNIHGPLFVAESDNPIVGNDQSYNLAHHNMNGNSVVVVASDPDSDLAILKARAKPSQVHDGILGTAVQLAKGATLRTDDPSLGERLLLSGYPLDRRLLVLQTGTATGLDYPVGTNSPNSLRIMLSLVSNPGNSGGPVLDSSGNVVALLEGNFSVQVRDADGKQTLWCLRAKLDATGNPLKDPAGNPIPEATPCMQNTGISYAVPARFIADLARKNNIKLQ